MSIDNTFEDCDGSCSSLDSTSARLISHKEAEQAFNKAVKPNYHQVYNQFTGFLKGCLYELYKRLARFK